MHRWQVFPRLCLQIENLAFVYDRSFRHRRQRRARQSSFHQPGETVHGYPPDPSWHSSGSARRGHHADGWVRLFPQQIEERRHGVPPGFPVQRHVHRLTIALYVYYPIALHHFYLFVSREDMGRPAWTCGFAPRCKWLVSLFSIVSDCENSAEHYFRTLNPTREPAGLCAVAGSRLD